MAPTLARWPGGYVEPFSMRSSPTGVARDGDSPRVVLSGGGVRRVASDGGRLAPIFGDGRSSWWGFSGDKK
jgi:hypothetical protein